MSLVPATHEPAHADLDSMIRVSQMLSKSSLVPAAYRGKPENVLLAALAGQAYGWDPTMAMRSFHVIEGTPSLKPEIMLALVRRAGHSVSGETTPDGATVTGKRSDTGDTMTVSFTLEDARRAGLANKSVWKQYPASMCWARALSQLCRMLFPDVVLGAGYTPEELGAASNEDQAPAPAVGFLSPAEAKFKLLDAAGGDREIARQVWTEAHMDGEVAIDADALEVLCERAQDLTTTEAEVVDLDSTEEFTFETPAGGDTPRTVSAETQEVVR